MRLFLLCSMVACACASLSKTAASKEPEPEPPMCDAMVDDMTADKDDYTQNSIKKAYAKFDKEQQEKLDAATKRKNEVVEHTPPRPTAADNHEAHVPREYMCDTCRAVMYQTSRAFTRAETPARHRTAQENARRAAGKERGAWTLRAFLNFTCEHPIENHTGTLGQCRDGLVVRCVNETHALMRIHIDDAAGNRAGCTGTDYLDQVLPASKPGEKELCVPSEDTTVSMIANCSGADIEDDEVPLWWNWMKLGAIKIADILESEVCTEASFDGYAIKRHGGVSMLDGPGTRTATQPGRRMGAIWGSRMKNRCQELVEDIGDDQLYATHSADDRRDWKTMVKHCAKECDAQPRSTADPKTSKRKRRNKKKKKKKKSKSKKSKNNK